MKPDYSPSWYNIVVVKLAKGASMSMKVIILITAVAAASIAAYVIRNKQGAGGEMGYKHIDQQTAMSMMAKDDGLVVVDVRRQSEYEGGHIPGAILIPNESIGANKPAELGDLNQTILVYCRSGARAKQAAQKLAAIGYTSVYEFGGIMSWKGEVVK